MVIVTVNSRGLFMLAYARRRGQVVRVRRGGGFIVRVSLGVNQGIEEKLGQLFSVGPRDCPMRNSLRTPSRGKFIGVPWFRADTRPIDNPSPSNKSCIWKLFSLSWIKSEKRFVCYSLPCIVWYFVCRVLEFPSEGWSRLRLNHGSITWTSISF